jgi:DNA-directed RNA polymerase specialized sigma24 family protein
VDSDHLWKAARQHAQNYLRRFGDAWTCSNREDLVQQAAFAAWRWAAHVRDPGAFWAAVRTISRRLRGRGLDDAEREREAHLVLGAPCDVDSDDGERHYFVAGSKLPAHEVRPLLQRALARLSPLDRQLLLGFHEGFCCAELAVRTGRTEHCVKTRIHRARRRVRKDIEEDVRAADDVIGGNACEQ